MSTIVFGTVLPWLLIAVGAWLGYQLVRQNGRILLRLESIEKHLRPRDESKRRNAGGLPLGALAPDFELPNLLGERRKLSDYRGQNLLLVFFNPQCGFCEQMAADLAAVSNNGNANQAMPVVVSTGDAEANRRFFEQHGIRCTILLQEQMEVASTFLAQGTPMGYRIDGAGRIASELAVGAEPVLNLADLGDREQRRTANNLAKHHAKDDPSLSRSRLNRNGLKAGAEAPDFRLPRIDGGELSLADFRGTRVLLVFSSPDCGPCDELAPHLQEIHAERSDIQVLVVSRGDAEANRTKAHRLGLSYPIVLQKQWEVSLKYAMFATPIGYLIDESGRILNDVAVGIDPIRSLSDRSVLEPQNDSESNLSPAEQAWAI